MACDGKTCTRGKIVCADCGRVMNEADFTEPMKKLASHAASYEGFLNHALYLLGCFTGCRRPSEDEINVRPSETVTKLKEPEIEMIYKLYKTVDDYNGRKHQDEKGDIKTRSDR